MLLKRRRRPAKDIKLRGRFAVSEDALRQGRVDAVNMNQPFAARAEAKGGTRKLFFAVREMPNIVHILEACRADFSSCRALIKMSRRISAERVDRGAARNRAITCCADIFRTALTSRHDAALRIDA